MKAIFVSQSHPLYSSKAPHYVLFNISHIGYSFEDDVFLH